MKFFIYSLLCISFTNVAFSATLQTHYRFTNWSIYQPYAVQDLIDLDVDVINYERLNLTENAEIVSNDTFADFEYKQFPNQTVDGSIAHFRSLKNQAGVSPRIILVIGGWGDSENFSPVMASQKKQGMLLSNMQEWFDRTGVDGFEINWRYPVFGGSDNTKHSPEDGKNLLSFLEKYKKRFPNKIISLTVSNVPMKSQKLDIKALSSLVNFFILPTDGMHGPWDSAVFHQTPLYQVDDNNQYSISSVVQSYVNLGVNPEKLVISISPAVKRSFNTQGLYQNFEQEAGQKGSLSFKEVGLSRIQAQWDSLANASFYYDESKRIFYSFETAKSVSQKSDFSKRHHLKAISLTENYMLSDSVLLKALKEAKDTPMYWIWVKHFWFSIKKALDLLTLSLMVLVIILISSLIIFRWFYLQQKERDQIQRFKYLLEGFNQEFSLIIDWHLLSNHNGAQDNSGREVVSLMQCLPLMQKVSLQNQLSPWLSQSHSDSYHYYCSIPIGYWLVPFAKKNGLPLLAMSSILERKVTISLSKLWIASEQVILLLNVCEFVIVNEKFVLMFRDVSLLQYLKANTQNSQRLWEQAGGECFYDRATESLALSLEFTTSMEPVKNEQALTVISKQKTLTTDISTLINKLNQSKEIDQQIECLLDCFEAMGFAGADVQQEGRIIRKFGRTALPSRWQYHIKSMHLWQINLYQDEVLDPHQEILLNALLGQFQLLQTILKKIGQSPQFLLDLYEVSRIKEKIIYIEANKGYSVIFYSPSKNSEGGEKLKEKIITIRLKQILNYFEEKHLVQIHRSYLVNPSKVERVIRINSRKAEVKVFQKTLPMSKNFFENIPD